MVMLSFRSVMDYFMRNVIIEKLREISIWSYFVYSKYIKDMLIMTAQNSPKIRKFCRIVIIKMFITMCVCMNTCHTHVHVCACCECMCVGMRVSLCMYLWRSEVSFSMLSTLLGSLIEPGALISDRLTG